MSIKYAILDGALPNPKNKTISLLLRFLLKTYLSLSIPLFQTLHRNNYRIIFYVRTGEQDSIKKIRVLYVENIENHNFDS